MCHKTKSSKEDEDTEEGFEDLSTSDVNNIHHGYLNPGFDGQTTKETPIDKVDNSKWKVIFLTRGVKVGELKDSSFTIQNWLSSFLAFLSWLAPANESVHDYALVSQAIWRQL